MDCFTKPGIEEIVFCSATQLGKTETMNNSLCYIINQDPAPTMFVYPRVEDAESISKNRIQPMIRACPELDRKWFKNSSVTLELQFWGMYLALSGANSAASLASKPIKYLFLDEVDKYPPFIGEEGDPISLAMERQKTFDNAVTLMASTPTTVFGNIWRYLQSSDVVMRFFVPCPECGRYQILEFRHLKWPDWVTKEFEEARDDLQKIRIASQRARDHVWYECPFCGAKILNYRKNEMLASGEWRPGLFDNDAWHELEECPSTVRRIGFQLSTMYSPFPKATWGHMTAEFLQSKDFPERLRNFINSWLAEPWKEKKENIARDKVLRNSWKHERGTVPEEARLLTAGVDVQKGHAWYVIRAWGVHMTSWLIDYGRFETWDESDLENGILHRLVEAVYTKESSGNRMQVNLGFMDMGYRTDEVYTVCGVFRGLICPCKGASERLDTYFREKSVERRNKKSVLVRYDVNTDLFKDFVFGRLEIHPGDKGAWMVFADCPSEYAEQICSETKVTVTDRKRGVSYRTYRPIGSHAKNHLLDCEVYAACAARVLGAHLMVSEEDRATRTRGRHRKVLSRGVQ